MGLVIVGLRLDHVAGLEFVDGLVALRRQERRAGDEADDGEVGAWLVGHGLFSLSKRDAFIRLNVQGCLGRLEMLRRIFGAGWGLRGYADCETSEHLQSEPYLSDFSLG